MTRPASFLRSLLTVALAIALAVAVSLGAARSAPPARAASPAPPAADLTGHWSAPIDPRGIDISQAPGSGTFTGSSAAGVSISGTLSGLHATFIFWSGKSYASSDVDDRGTGTMEVAKGGASAYVTWKSEGGRGKYNGSFTMTLASSGASSKPSSSPSGGPSASPSDQPTTQPTSEQTLAPTPAPPIVTPAPAPAKPQPNPYLDMTPDELEKLANDENDPYGDKLVLWLLAQLEAMVKQADEVQAAIDAEQNGDPVQMDTPGAIAGFIVGTLDDTVTDAAQQVVAP
jgi:hypothetical protein